MSDSSKDGTLALCGSLMGLSIIAVGLRLWARRRYHLRFMADDWTAGLALLSYIGASICVFIMVHNKLLGYSSHDFTPEQVKERGKTNEVSQIVLDLLTNNTLACIKLSAVFFYRRIFCTSGKRTTFGTFLTGFQCGTHFSALWDGSYTKYCTISFPFLYGLVISDFLLDIWILALPIPNILYLYTTLQRKLAIMSVFLLAFIGLGASIARMVQYIKIERGGPNYLLNTDHERLITQSFFYTMLEAGIALVAVNIPSLRAFTASFEAEGLMRSVRSFIGLSILRNSSNDIARNTSEVQAVSNTAGINEYGKALSFSTELRESFNEPQRDLPWTMSSATRP
ncbi:hypothetical protein Daesc_010461 [Daldinia eschscholtzii]|uniref:Rhodopsin domain-containing protein n=1 Tax=Daldinia eschscholtzii TaxID=292717 RepID=A0AAX6M922_9PEZI